MVVEKNYNFAWLSYLISEYNLLFRAINLLKVNLLAILIYCSSSNLLESCNHILPPFFPSFFIFFNYNLKAIAIIFRVTKIFCFLLLAEAQSAQFISFRTWPCEEILEIYIRSRGYKIICVDKIWLGSSGDW